MIETNANWNYSRSLLFAWAIPYYHFGLRTTFPVGAHFTGGVQVVNGWNNIEDNNSGKTVGLTGAFTIHESDLVFRTTTRVPRMRAPTTVSAICSTRRCC